ncbi:hypothetical protein ABBQ32_007311 [Trebouxia sp. C0010 RCD-2024]
MRNCPDLSAALADLYDKPLLGPKPNQLLVFKRPQLAVKLESLMQATSSAAAKHMNIVVDPKCFASPVLGISRDGLIA